MNNLLTIKLETLKEFQEKYPTSHVGGSIGLYLRGVDLKRDLSKSDLDITIDELIEEANSFYSIESSSNDFDYITKMHTDNGSYIKIEIRICPEPSFDVIEFEGVNYNVSKYRDIIFWKTKYANKGIQKHKDDLETIKTGIRPLEPVSVVDDGLPF
jgi:hypothetical protein